MIIWCIRRKKNSHRLYPQRWDIYPAAGCNTPASNNIDSVSAIANKVLQAVLESYTPRHHVLSISASIAISRCPENSENVDKLMKQADIAMYKAKQEGKIASSSLTHLWNSRPKVPVNKEKNWDMIPILNKYHVLFAIPCY
jgi:GGDEF domain-containing protein